MKEILEKYCTLFTKDLYELKNMTLYYTTEGVYFYVSSEESFEKPFTDKNKLEAFLIAIS